MAKQIGNPELVETWGSEGDVSEPFLSKKRQGWLFQEQPASSIANWLVNTQQQKINHLLKNGVSEWSSNTDYTRGACVKHANTAWKALRDNTASEPAPGNEDWAEISTLPLIRRPELESPINGESDVATAAPLEASEYAAVYSSDVRDYRRFEVDISGGDFSSPVVTNEVDADDWTVDPILSIDTGYIWRCKDVSVRGDESEWSDVEGFVTGSVFVTTPSITAPADNADEIGETPTFTSSAFAVTGGSDTHVASYWRVFQGTTEVWASGRTTSDLESVTIPSGILQDGETVYTVQVKHEGGTYGTSSWSAASTFTTLDSFTRVATPSITSPSDGEIDLGETPTFTSSAFSVINGSDTHIASTWEVYTPADALVWSSGRTTVERTSITMPSGILDDGETTYKVRVRHEGNALGVSEWSATVDFVTLESFGQFYTGSANNIVRSISASTLNQTATFTGHLGGVNAVAYGSDGFVYTGSEDNTVRKLDRTTLAEIASFAGHTDAVNDVIYSVDGFVYSASSDGTVRKIDPSDMSQSGSFTGHSGAVLSLASGDGGFVYSGGNDNAVRKITASDMTQAAAFTGNNGDVLSLCVGSDDYLYSGASNSKVIKIATSTMSQVDIYDSATTITVWEDTTRLLVSIFNYGSSLSISSLTADAQAEFDKFGTSATSYTLYSYSGNGASTTSLTLSGIRVKPGTTKSKIPSGTADNGWTSSGTWNPGDDRVRWAIGNIQKSTTQTATKGSVNTLCFGDDGNLYAGFENNNVLKIDVSDMSVTQTFQGHTQPVKSLTFGSDGFLYSGANDNIVRRIDVSDMTQDDTFSGNTDNVTALAFNISVPDLLGFTA